MGFPYLQTLLCRLALRTDSNAKMETSSRGARGFAASYTKIALWTACICVVGTAIADAQTGLPARENTPNLRLMSVTEGRAIVRTAFQGDEREQAAPDCSHAVHAVYAAAGFAYPYASSLEIYSGNDNFARVNYPRAGDVIAWPGHLGIVVNPTQHSFFSLVRAGLRVCILAVERTAKILPAEGRARRRAERSEKFGNAENQESDIREVTEVTKRLSKDKTPKCSPRKFDGSGARAGRLWDFVGFWFLGRLAVESEPDGFQRDCEESGDSGWGACVCGNSRALSGAVGLH
jgi:hypothetical protein